MRTKDATKVAKMAQTISKDMPRAGPRPNKPMIPPKESNLGRQIFIYNHLQTNQVVYSLKRSLKNNHALRQLPYNGKKTVPPALRKDLWSPLACIDFTETISPNPSSLDGSSTPPPPPPQHYGLKVLHQMREYRKLHETQWPKSFAIDPKTNRPLSRTERGRRLCDQKANSIADMAAALAAVTVRTEVTKKEVEVEREASRGKKKLETEVRETKSHSPLVRVTVQWSNILDAEFAEAWPETVVHDQWVTTFNNRKPRIMGTELPLDSMQETEAALEPVKNEAGKVVL